MKCLMCGKGMLKKTMTQETMFGVDLGRFPVQQCSYCGETFTNESATRMIENSAKKKGIWGIGTRTKL